MYLVAKEVMADLEKLRLLPCLFNKEPVDNSDVMIDDSLLDKISSSTKLVIVGHSLGGGAASLMSLFLQKSYPNTCCCYDPPGETLSPGLREYSTHFITTTVFGHDIFPRVSSYTFSLLQDNIIASLAYCKINKYKYFLNVAFNRVNMNTTFFTDIKQTAPEIREVLDQWLVTSTDFKKKFARECYLPGNIVYIRFDKLKVLTNKGHKKTLVKENAVHAVAEEFLDLRLGNHFFFNHWIFLFPIWLKRAAENCS